MEFLLVSLMVVGISALLYLLDVVTGGLLLGALYGILGLSPAPSGLRAFLLAGAAHLAPLLAAGIPLHLWRRHCENTGNDLPALLRRFAPLAYAPTFLSRLSLYAVAGAVLVLLSLLLHQLGMLPAWLWWAEALLALGLWLNLLLPVRPHEYTASPAATRKAAPPEEQPPLPERPSALDMVKQLRAGPAYRGQMVVPEAVEEATPFEPMRDVERLRGLLEVPVDRALPSPGPAGRGVRAGSPALAVLPRLGIADLSRLYRHQGEAWHLLLTARQRGRRCVLLASPQGSGRFTLIALATLDYCLRQGQGVLYVCPDERAAADVAARLRTTFAATDWQWGLDLLCLDRPDEYEAKITEVTRQLYAASKLGPDAETMPGPALLPDVVVVSLQVLHSMLLADHRKRWYAFLAALDLVVVENMEAFQGALGCNAAMVFRRLNRLCGHYGSEPRYFATCPPLDGLQSFASALLGVDVRAADIVTGDGKPAPAQVSVLWRSSLDTPATHERGQQLRGHEDWDALSPTDRAHGVRRLNPLLETQRLLRELMLARFRTVLVTPSIAVTDEDLRELEWQLRGSDAVLADLRVVRSLNDEPGAQNGYDAAVIAGLPGTSGALHYEFRHLQLPGRGDTLLCVVPARLPLTQYHTRAGVRPYLPPRPDQAALATVKYDNPAILRKHLLCALKELPLTQEEADRFFAGAAGPMLQHLVGKRLATVTRTQVLSRSAPVPAAQETDLYALAPGVEKEKKVHATDVTVIDDDTAVTLEVAGGSVHLRLDRSQALRVAYPNAILSTPGERYDVERWQPEQDRPIPETIFLSPADTTALTGPQITSRIARVELLEPLPGHRNWSQERFGGAQQMPTYSGPGRVREIVEGCAYHSAFEWDPQQAAKGDSQWKPERSPRLEYETEVLVLQFPENTGIPVLRTLRNAFLSTIQLVLPGLAEHVLIDWDVPGEGSASGPVVFFYDDVPFGHGGSRALGDHRILRHLLLTTYDLLMSCPCRGSEGCPNCCQLPETAGMALDKSGALAALRNLLGDGVVVEIYGDRGALAALWQSDQPCTQLAELQRLRTEVVDRLMPAVLGITIPAQQRAAVAFMNPEDIKAHPDFGGFFTTAGDDWLVKTRSCSPQQTFGVLAHEYAHNWQAVPGNFHPDLAAEGVPFKKRLLVEGFAQWVEFRLLDVLGLSDLMANITFSHYDEYGEGFWAVKYVEDLAGVAGVLQFMREGSAFLRSHPAFGFGELKELFRRAHIDESVRDKERKLIEEGKDLPEDDWVGLSDLMARFP